MSYYPAGGSFSGGGSSSGALNYKGVWNANTNSPTLASGVGTKGNYYVVGVAGTTTIDGISDWEIGDWIIFNGTAWEKADHTDQVSSVFTRKGAVVAQANDYTWAQIDKTASSLADITTRNYSDLQGIPSEFTPSAHVHSGADITSGNLDIARMPTGGTWTLSSDLTLSGAQAIKWAGGYGVLRPVSANENYLWGSEVSADLGTNTICIGRRAGYSRSGGNYNVVVGDSAGYSMTSSAQSTLVGAFAGYNLTTARGVAFGYQALRYMIGDDNMGIGTMACMGSTTPANNTGQGNFGLGLSTLENLTSGNYNLGIHTNAFRNRSTGSSGVAIGFNAGYDSNGDNVLFIGNYAGRYETGNYKMIFDVFDRSTEAGQRNSAPIYGELNTTVASQYLMFNANVVLNNGYNDCDLTINKLTSGTAAYYNCGTDDLYIGSKTYSYIGTTAPTFNSAIDGDNLSMLHEGGNTIMGFERNYSSSGQLDCIRMGRSLGTNASKSAVLADRWLGGISWYGYRTTATSNYSQAFTVDVISRENFTSTATKSDMVFYAYPDGSTATEAMRVGYDSAGTVRVYTPYVMSADSDTFVKLHNDYLDLQGNANHAMRINSTGTEVNPDASAVAGSWLPFGVWSYETVSAAAYKAIELASDNTLSLRADGTSGLLVQIHQGTGGAWKPAMKVLKAGTATPNFIDTLMHRTHILSDTDLSTTSAYRNSNMDGNGTGDYLETNSILTAIANQSANGSVVAICSNRDDSAESVSFGLLLGKQNGGSYWNNSFGQMSDGQKLLGIGFEGLSLNGIHRTYGCVSAAIQPVIDGTVSSGVLPARLNFMTSETRRSGLATRLSIRANGNIEINKNLTVGSGEAGVDYTLTFNGEDNDGILTWKEDENRFNFNKMIECAEDLVIASTKAFYLGDEATDGTWRIIRSGNNLVIERRESGSYVTKSTISA